MAKNFSGALEAPVLLATPAAPTATPQGTPGAQTVTYKVEALSDTGHSIASAGGTTTTAHATIDGTNYVKVDWVAITGATGYKLYRTVGGATQGLVATLGAVITYNDTGTAASVATPAAANVPGAGAAVEVAHLDSVVARVGGTFVGTVQVQVSADGVYFSPYGADITTPTTRPITMPAVKQIRLAYTAYTSGTPVTLYGGTPR